jgi:hypothetical protein
MTIVKFAAAAAAAITIAGMYPYASLAAGATELPPPLKPETTDVATLAPGIAHRFIAIPYEGSMQVLNGDRIYIAETMWTHNNRGTRIDLLTVYDTKTLTAVKEIPLPGRPHSLVARYPVHSKFSSATPDGTMRGIAVSQDDKPSCI